MLLYHLSPYPFRNLSPSFSRAFARVWLAKPSKLASLMLHLPQHHKKPMRYLYLVSVPRSKVRRMRRGIYVTYEAVVPIFAWRLDNSLIKE